MCGLVPKQLRKGSDCLHTHVREAFQPVRSSMPGMHAARAFLLGSFIHDSSQLISSSWHAARAVLMLHSSSHN